MKEQYSTVNQPFVNNFQSRFVKNKRLISQPFVAPQGFEPRQTESKSVVLPLYYGAIGAQK
jgi:hypothetical protein